MDKNFPKKFMKDKEAHELDQAQQAILDLISKYKILDPPDEDIVFEEAIELAKEYVRADLRSMKDAIRHFVMSVRNLPLYNQIEPSVDNMVAICSSIENMLDGKEPIVKTSLGLTPKMMLAHVLTMTYNHYQTRRSR